MIKKMLYTSMLLFVMGVQAQEIIECSPEKTFWLLNANGKNYAVTLPAKTVKTTHPKVVMAGGRNLQYLVVDKKESVEKAGTTDDLKVLGTYVGYESGYLAAQFMANMEIRSEVVALPGGKMAIYWSYLMPEGKNDEVEKQHFLNVVEGDVIFGLASAGFKGDNADETKQMLLKVMGSLTVVKDDKNLCK